MVSFSFPLNISYSSYMWWSPITLSSSTVLRNTSIPSADPTSAILTPFPCSIFGSPRLLTYTDAFFFFPIASLSSVLGGSSVFVEKKNLFYELWNTSPGTPSIYGQSLWCRAERGQRKEARCVVLATKVADVQRALCLTSTKIRFGVVSNSGLCYVTAKRYVVRV